MYSVAIPGADSLTEGSANKFGVVGTVSLKDSVGSL